MVIGHRSTMKCPLEKCPEKVAQNKDFIFTKSPTPHVGKVVMQKHIVSGQFSSPEQARAHIKALAQQAGCNAVLGLTCHRETVQLAPNYYNTFHRFSANIGVLVEDVSIFEQEKEQESMLANREIDQAKASLTGLVTTKQKEVLESQSGAGFWLTVLLFVGGALLPLL